MTTADRSPTRRAAFCNQSAATSRPRRPPVEGSVEPVDIFPPPLSPTDIIENPNARFTIYNEEVLIDSGASDSMAPTSDLLDLIEGCYVTVLLADGSVRDVNHQGVMRVLAKDADTDQEYIVPVPDTLLVPGLRKVLWSVAQLTRQGHQVIFGDTTVSLKLHVNTPDEFTIGLSHPFLTRHGEIPASFAAPASLHKELFGDSDDEPESDNDDESSLPPLFNPTTNTTIRTKDTETIVPRLSHGRAFAGATEATPTNQSSPPESNVPDVTAAEDIVLPPDNGRPEYLQPTARPTEIRSNKKRPWPDTCAANPRPLRPSFPALDYVYDSSDRNNNQKALSKYYNDFNAYRDALEVYQDKFGLMEGEEPIYLPKQYPTVVHDNCGRPDFPSNPEQLSPQI